MKSDRLLEYFLDFDGMKSVVDEQLGLWIKFDIKKVLKNIRKNGVRYSLSLHDRFNTRIIGFDNAHEIEYGAKQNVAPLKTYDHWHCDENDTGKPYNYKNAGKLFEDFCIEVGKKINQMRENLDE